MGDIRIRAAIEGDLERIMAEEAAKVDRAVEVGVKRAGDGLQRELRRQVRSAGLGRKLEKAWKAKFYPNNRPADAASLVYTKAPKLIGVFDKGAVIRAKNSRWLAVRTDAAPKFGVGRKRLTPANFPEQRFGKLRFVPRRTGPSLLVVDNVRIGKSGRVGRRLKSPRTKSGRLKSGIVTVVMFTLHRQVRLKKRLDIDRAATRWRDRLAPLIVRALDAEDAKAGDL